MARANIKNDMDFFEALRLRQQDTKPKGHPVRTALIAVAALALLGLAADWAWNLHLENTELDSGIAETEAYLNDESNISAAGETETVAGQTATLEEYNSQCDLYRGYLEGTDRLGSGHFDTISGLAPEGTTITLYEYAEGAVTISCVSDNKDGPAEYAENLTSSGKFADVGYAGFTAVSQGGAVVYTYTITCRYGGLD